MPTELVPGVYDVTCAETETGRIRAFLFEDGTLFDCGFEHSTDGLFDGIAETGISPKRLVITHGDADHAGAFDAVIEEYWPETYVPENTDLETEYEPDNYYGDGDEIAGFEAVHMPGHRADQHTFVDEDRGVAVLADALSGADQRGLPEGYFHLPPGVYSENLNRAEKSLERLLEYEFDTGLVYHGSSVRSDARQKLESYVYRQP